jgi:hypothetical protein
VRPSTSVAGAVLGVVLALIAIPGLATTIEPSPEATIDPARFVPVTLAERTDRWIPTIDELDVSLRADGWVSADARFVEPGASPPPLPSRVDVAPPVAASGWDWKAPRYTLSGYASFYAAGYTAMRLPRGTRVVICGGSGCLERVINDYGPSAAIHPNRIADLYVADFFRICGCPSWSGTTWVTVRVY